MSERYEKQGLAVVSVHTPKFEEERERAHVERAAKRFGLQHPIYLDNDGAYYDALGRAYRPAFYLVDRQGRLRVRHNGELHLDSGSGLSMEAEIKRLLAE